jgi:hypothetical protein
VEKKVEQGRERKIIIGEKEIQIALTRRPFLMRLDRTDCHGTPRNATLTAVNKEAFAESSSVVRKALPMLRGNEITRNITVRDWNAAYRRENVHAWNVGRSLVDATARA